eukprot:m.175380 g.175380  ORF g.175380 m.175380 type:complete len:604 (+) comp14611_c0_seq4:200-2011(+)
MAQKRSLIKASTLSELFAQRGAPAPLHPSLSAPPQNPSVHGPDGVSASAASPLDSPAHSQQTAASDAASDATNAKGLSQQPPQRAPLQLQLEDVLAQSRGSLDPTPSPFVCHDTHSIIFQDLDYLALRNGYNLSSGQRPTHIVRVHPSATSARGGFPTHHTLTQVQASTASTEANPATPTTVHGSVTKATTPTSSTTTAPAAAASLASVAVGPTAVQPTAVQPASTQTKAPNSPDIVILDSPEQNSKRLPSGNGPAPKVPHVLPMPAPATTATHSYPTRQRSQQQQQVQGLQSKAPFVGQGPIQTHVPHTLSTLPRLNGGGSDDDDSDGGDNPNSATSARRRRAAALNDDSSDSDSDSEVVLNTIKRLQTRSRSASDSSSRTGTRKPSVTRASTVPLQSVAAVSTAATATHGTRTMQSTSSVSQPHSQPTAPAGRVARVAFQHDGLHQAYSIAMNAQLMPYFEEFCKSIKISPDLLDLQYHQKSILPTDTPQILEMNSDGIHLIELLTLDDQLFREGEEVQRQQAKDLCLVQIRLSDRLSETYKLGNSAGFGEVLAKFAHAQKMQRSALRFTFEGEDVTDTSTPLALDMEGDGETNFVDAYPA